MFSKIRKEMVGNRYGKLIVLDVYGLCRGKGYSMLCKCDCGEYTLVYATMLRCGNTKSCGCYVREISSLNGKKAFKHGETKSRKYNIWRGIKARCFNEKNKDYCNYGGRGINICDEWREYENFSNWAIKNGYNDNLTIDRINVNDNYCPENCRWITREENNRTKRNVIKVKNGNDEYFLSELENKYDIPFITLYNRIKRNPEISFDRLIKKDLRKE